MHGLTPMQGTSSALLKGAKVLKGVGTVSDKINRLGASAPRTTLEIAARIMSWPIWPWDTTTAGRSEAPVKSVNGNREDHITTSKR
jgi:hypothetical protein